MSRPTLTVLYKTLEQAEAKVRWLKRNFGYVGVIEREERSKGAGFTVTWTRTDDI